MLRNKHKIVIAVIIVLAVAGFLVKRAGKGNLNNRFSVQEVKPFVGDIRITLSTTGVVEPQNRLEIKPPINGRVEEIIVNEGDLVNQGQILAWLSSTERAALVDAARTQGDEAIEYWEGVYKATPLISPIKGEVIVRAVEPGQTVTSADAVLVLSDRLIVKAQFDETDIGRVKKGQKAVITLDAYPEVKIKGLVDHIAYESQLVNNVIIYEVDILPEEIPEFFRSGMSANVEVVEKERNNVLLIPLEAVRDDNGRSVVLVKKSGKRSSSEVEVQTGLSDGENVEVVSGIDEDDTVFTRSKEYAPSKKNLGTNPFMPSPRNR